MQNSDSKTYSEATGEGPVFIVGMNGSGTTMLLDSLGRHSQLFGFPRETRMMPHVIKSIQAMGDLTDDATFQKAWQLVGGIPAIKFVNGGEPLPLPDDWCSRPRTVGAIFDSVFREFAAEEGKVRWCEKSPQHVQHLDLLREVFPNAKFIHVIRDGRAAAASFHRRWRRTPRLTIYRWKNVVRLGRSLGAQMPDRYFELQYETLTEEPELWMRKLCEFLGLEFEPAVLESRSPQSQQRGSEGRIKAREEAWRSYFCDREVRRLEEIGGAYLAESGYETRFHRGESEPTRGQLRWWRVKDAIWLFLLQVGRKVRGSSNKPWWRVLTQPLESLRQAKINDY